MRRCGFRTTPDTKTPDWSSTTLSPLESFGMDDDPDSALSLALRDDSYSFIWGNNLEILFLKVTGEERRRGGWRRFEFLLHEFPLSPLPILLSPDFDKLGKVLKSFEILFQAVIGFTLKVHQLNIRTRDQSSPKSKKLNKRKVKRGRRGEDLVDSNKQCSAHAYQVHTPRPCHLKDPS